MSSRSIFVTLGLKADGFKREADSAAQSLGKITQSADKVGVAGAKGFKGFTAQVRENETHMRTLGVGLLGVGTAMLGVTTAVAKTGIEYNTLQQSSRAALKVLVGGAEQANAQMDKLDAFARTSPFSKATFIQAQQQMLGFGIEAQKVVPYLTSIQDATAAIGGSNNEISQIVDVFAKIQSQGKITARELMQLGIHGIDAAQLIGDAMGKTANQIRDDITAGTLDAGTALDALSQGMDARFGGAAAAVKDTMVGALDRVKAAFRDFSASVMEPFVSQDGGGLLVDWTNSFADAIRMVDKLPQVVKTGGGVLTGIGGAALVAAGGFLTLAPRIAATSAALDALQASGGGLGAVAGGIRHLGAVAKTTAAQIAPFALAAGATWASAASIKSVSEYAMGFKEVDQSVDGLINRLTVANTTGTMYDRVLGDMVESGRLTVSLHGDMANAIKTTNRANRFFLHNIDAFAYKSGLAAGGTIEMVDRIKALDTAFTQMDFQQAAGLFKQVADEAIAGGSSIEAVKDAFPGFAAAVDSAATELGISADAAWQMILANGELANSSGDVAVGLDGAAEAAAEAAAQMDAYREALQGLVSLTDALADSFVAGREAERGFTAAMEEFAGITEMSDAALDAFGKTQRDHISTMISARDANGDLIYSEAELVSMMGQARGALVDAGVAMGMSATEANVLADNLGLIPEDVPIRIAAENDASAEIEAILEGLDGIPPDVMTTIMAHDEASAVTEIVRDAVENGIPVEKIVDIIAKDGASKTAAQIDTEVRKIPRQWVSDLLAKDNSSRFSRLVKGAVEAIPGSKNTLLTATDNATPILSRIQGVLAGIRSKIITVTTQHVQVGKAGAGRATGGAVFGPGSGTSDDIPVWLSNSEHVMTAAEVSAFGGHGNVYALRGLMRSRPQDLRAALGLAGGGVPGGGSPVMVTMPSTQQGVPPSVYVTTFVENPFSGEQVEARVARTVVKYL